MEPNNYPFNRAVSFIFKNPVSILLIALPVLAYCLAEHYIFLPLSYAFSALLSGNIFENIMYVYRLIFKIIFLIFKNPTVLFAFLTYTIAFAIGSGIVLTILFNVIDQALNGNLHLELNMFSDLKKHLLKMSTISFYTIYTTLALIVFVMVSAIPSVIISKLAFSEIAGHTGVATFMDILTIAVLSSLILLYITYMVFWCPSAFYSNSKTLLTAKNIVNSHFTKIVISALICICAFITYQLIFTYTSSSLTMTAFDNIFASSVLFTTNALVKAVFLMFISAHVLSATKSYTTLQS